VAIARVDFESSPAIPLQAHAPVGSPIRLISHPDRHYYMYTQGHVARYSRRQRRSGTESRMAVTADFAKGSSGGPVLNAQGNVVGMVCSTHSIYYEPDQKHLQMVLKLCIPAAEILKLVD
jgi:S1-C subfamily serine protease